MGREGTAHHALQTSLNLRKPAGCRRVSALGFAWRRQSCFQCHLLVTTHTNTPRGLEPFVADPGVTSISASAPGGSHPTAAPQPPCCWFGCFHCCWHRRHSCLRCCPASTVCWGHVMHRQGSESSVNCVCMCWWLALHVSSPAGPVWPVLRSAEQARRDARKTLTPSCCNCCRMSPASIAASMMSLSPSYFFSASAPLLRAAEKEQHRHTQTECTQQANQH